MADKSFLDWPFFEPHHRELAARLGAWAADTLPQIFEGGAPPLPQGETSAKLEHSCHPGRGAARSGAPQTRDPVRSQGASSSRDPVSAQRRFAPQRARDDTSTTRNAGEGDVDATCRALVAALGKAGWLRYCVPAAHGGAHENLDVRALSLIRETLSYHAPLADFAFAMQGLGAGAISTFGSEALKKRYLPAVAAGDMIAAFALSEENAGSDVSAMTTAIRRDGADYIVDGEKTWISNGGIADFYTLFARGEGGRVSAVVVDAGSPGLSIAERIDLIAPHPLARLRFENCRVPADRLIGAEGEGMKVALSTLDIFRTTVGAAALGLARRALDEATAHAAARKMFGGTLADQPLAQSILAEMALDVDAAALLVYRSAWTKDVKKARVTREAAMAKLYATDRAQIVIDKAVQLFGGLGVKKGMKVEELYRDVRALRIYEGASEVQKLVIARQHLAGFRSSLR